MKIIHSSELRLNLKMWLDIVVDEYEELVIKRKDNKHLVLISLEEFRDLKETQHLATGVAREHLLISLEEVQQGRLRE